MDLRVEFAGLVLKNPIITASGTFGFGLEFMDFGDLKRLGGIVVKGLSLKPREGNPMPRIVETPCGMLNAIGIQNPGVEAFVRDKLPLLPWRETAIITNLYACSVPEFGELTSVLAGEEGVAALEVNVSCPNVQSGGAAFGQDPTQIRKVTEEVKKRAAGKPVIVKLSPNVTDIALCARAAQEGGGRCALAHQHAAGHGRGHPHAKAPSGQCGGRAVRTGHQARGVALRVPGLPRCQHPGHRHRRDCERRGRAGIHPRGRIRRASGHGKLPAPGPGVPHRGRPAKGHAQGAQR